MRERSGSIKGLSSRRGARGTRDPEWGRERLGGRGGNIVGGGAVAVAAKRGDELLFLGLLGICSISSTGSAEPLGGGNDSLGR